MQQKFMKRVAASSLPLLLVLGYMPVPAHSDAGNNEQSLFTMDEDIWVMFYDVPSRRFRSIRDRFVVRDYTNATRDLKISAGFLRAETERAVPELQNLLKEVTDRLEYIAANIDDAGISVEHLDVEFGRAHWLLGQHYLVRALYKRDENRHRQAGNYLLATAHHLERAVIWSGFKIDDQLLDRLESIRDLALKLQTSPRPELVYRERPVQLAARMLMDIAGQINRMVRIGDQVQPELAR